MPEVSVGRGGTAGGVTGSAPSKRVDWERRED